MSRFFLFLYHRLSVHPLLPWILLVFICIPVFYFASKIKTDEDITKILPNSRGGMQYQEVLKKAGVLEKLVIRIALKDSATLDADRLTTFATYFIKELQKDTSLKPYLKDIRHKLPDDLMLQAYQNFYDYLPYFLDAKDYQRLDSMLLPEQIQLAFKKNYATLMSPMGMVLKDKILDDPLHFTPLALAKLQALQINKDYDLYDGYVMRKDKSALLIVITPRFAPNETAPNKKMLDLLDHHIAESIQKEYNDVSVEYFGASAVAVANATQIQRDIWVTATISILSIFALLWWYFRKLALPLVILMPIVFGIGLSLAFIYWYKQTISSVALGGGVVIIGIAINYALHVFTHYKHTRSIKVVINDLATPLLVGNISTVAAFLSLSFVQSKILFDFGLFSGISLIGAIIFTLIFLPHLIKYFDVEYPSPKTSSNFFSLHPKLLPAKKVFHKYAAFLILGLSILFYFTYSKVKFEDDLNALNFTTDKLKTAEVHLSPETKGEIERTIYLLYEGKNLNDALAQSESAMPQIAQLQGEGKVNKYFGVNGLLPGDIELIRRKAKWDNFWSAPKIDSLKKNIAVAAPANGFKPQSFDAFVQWLEKDVAIVNADTLLALQHYFLKDFISKDASGKYVVMAGLKIPPAQSTTVYETLATNSNQYILDKQYLIKKFVEIVKQDFNQILFTSSLLVFGILLIFYGRIELALITFLPMLLSWLWIVGLMGIFDIRFNIVNIIISAFIFGLGDDFSIFMMDGLLAEYRDGTKNLPSYKISIILAAITTLLGVGVLLFAQHPALQSIALISVIGISCVLFISYFFIPMLFRFLIGNRVNKGLQPVTLFYFVSSLLAFTAFLLGIIFLALTGIILFKIFRFKEGKPKLFYHYLIMYFARILVYGVYFIKKDYQNKHKEALVKPAIIIANHQSFLDILVILAAHPRILLFTNSWVWNSPFLGPIARMAGFFSIAQGVENSFEMVQHAVSEGYSIAVYPEGARSADLEIKRFHKGAFLLAEKLQLDLLPVVIHGTGHCMSKHDYLLQSGVLTMKILPRIAPNDPVYSTTYQDRTKKVLAIFRQEYQLLREENENLTFYKNKIVQKFIYKTPQLEWYTKIKIQLEKNYEVLHALIPKQGRVYDIGCGYGYFSMMMAYMSPQRNILGLDFDEEKIKIAHHANHDLEHLNFVASDANAYNYEPAEAIIISDVLHYMSEAQQQLLLTKCVSALTGTGVLIIRDADSSKATRHWGTKVSEFFSVKLLGFNKSDNKNLYFFSSSTIINFLEQLNVNISVIDKTKFNSNIIYYIKKN